MPVIGSSSITPDFNAVGPSGPSGATVAGPIGNTGATGSTGPTGATGVYVVSSSKEFPYLNLHLSDGSIVQIDGVAGITGATGAVRGVNLGDGITIFSTVGNGVTGATMWFRGITSDGSISIYLSEDSNTIAVSGDAIKQGGTAGTLATDRFLYLSDGGTASASGLTFESGGIMSFDNTVTLDPEENIITIGSVESFGEIVGITGGEVVVGGETAGDGRGIQLEVRHASVYKIYTPIGIGGFTGEFNSDEVFSFSAVINGNHIWTFPSNIYFEEDDAYFSCAEDIINFISDDGGSTWNASFAARGYGAEIGECDGIQTFGSCCYNDDNGLQQCIEYITQNSCQEDFNNGTWGSNFSCEDNCGRTAEGICCSEGGDWGGFEGTGLCIQGSGVAECNYFGGSFWNYFYYDIEGELLEGEPVKIECAMDLPDGYDKLCAEPCIESLCCKDGVCIGDSIGSTIHGSVSPLICKRVFGGQVIENAVCGEVDCCNYSKMEGACCYPAAGDPYCDVISAFDCTSSGGIFMGPDTECSNDVCCFDDEIGLCCLDSNACDCCGSGRENSNCCKNLNSYMCQRIGGIWSAKQSCPDIGGDCQCGTSELCIQPDEPTGACCVSGDYINQCYNNQTQNHCVAFLYGEYMGNNSLCTDKLCAWDTEEWGACCVEDGCIIQTQLVCSTLLGSWNGSPTCDGIECCGDDTIGGCCSFSDLGDPECNNLNVCQCDERDGVFKLQWCYGSLCNDVGACCYTDYSCNHETSLDCTFNGGAWHDEACVKTDCGSPPATGACCIAAVCYENGVYTEKTCIAAGGTYQGDDVECIPGICDPPCTGGCCVGNGICKDVNEVQCSVMHGGWAGCGNICIGCNPTGACCHTEYQCDQQTAADCAALEGEYSEDGNTDCSFCVAPEWGCCIDYECSQQTEADCDALDGEWNEGSTTCANCVAPSVCCTQDICTLKDTADACTAIGGRFHENETSCDVFDCPEWGACCTKNGDCGNNDDPVCNSCTYCCNDIDDNTGDVCANAGGGALCNKFNPWSTCDEVNSDNCCDDPLIYGACCDYENGICSQQTEAGCYDLNYYYHGDNTICADIICCDGGGDVNSCCYVDGAISLCGRFPECLCDALQGWWIEDGIDHCQETYCQLDIMAACCSEEWGCYVTTNQICTGNDDLPTTEGACYKNLCDTWMCCDDVVGECNDTLKGKCNYDWTYGEMCADNECTCSNCGACCRVTFDDCVNPTCTYEDSSADCTGKYSTFNQGAQCPFDGGPACPTSTGACCQGDETCEDFDTQADCGDGNSWYGCDTDCSQDGINFDCNDPDVGACCFPWGVCADNFSKNFCDTVPGAIFHDTPNDCNQITCEARYWCKNCPHNCEVVTAGNKSPPYDIFVDNSCDKCFDTCTGSCCYTDATQCRTCVDGQTKEECDALCACDSSNGAWDEVNLCLDRTDDCDTDETGACCFGGDCCDTVNLCQDQPCAACNANSSYEWQEYGTACSDDWDCPWACCPHDGGECSEETDGDCTQMPGTHYPDSTCSEIGDVCDRGWCCTGETGEDNEGCDLSNRQACFTANGYFVADADADAGGAAKQFCDSSCRLEVACCIESDVCVDPWDFAANDGCIMNDNTYDCFGKCRELDGSPHPGQFGTPCDGGFGHEPIDCQFGACCWSPTEWRCLNVTEDYCNINNLGLNWDPGVECLMDDGSACDNNDGQDCDICSSGDVDGACCVGWKCSVKSREDCEIALGAEPLWDGTNFYPHSCCGADTCSGGNCCCLPEEGVSGECAICQDQSSVDNYTKESCLAWGGVPCTRAAETPPNTGPWLGCKPDCCGGTWSDACNDGSVVSCEECYCYGPPGCYAVSCHAPCNYGECVEWGDVTQPACRVCPNMDDPNQGGVCAYLACEVGPNYNDYNELTGHPCGPGANYCHWHHAVVGSADECSDICGGLYRESNGDDYCLPYHPRMWAYMTTPPRTGARILRIGEVALQGSMDWWEGVKHGVEGGALYKWGSIPHTGCDTNWCGMGFCHWGTGDAQCNQNTPDWPDTCEDCNGASCSCNAPYGATSPCAEEIWGQCEGVCENLGCCCWETVCGMIRNRLIGVFDVEGSTCVSATGELPATVSCLNVGACDIPVTCQLEEWQELCNPGLTGNLTGNSQYLQLPDGRCEWIDCNIENGCPYPLCTNGT